MINQLDSVPSTMQSRKRITAAAAIVAAFLTTMVAHAGSAFADSGNGLIVPMYGWDAGWSKVINAKDENKGTEIVVIINPSNGAGGSKDSHWVDVTDDLQDAGIEVVGYVSTAYAGRSEGEAKDEIDRYYDWYGLDGVFLDEVSPSDHDYYKDLEEYADPDGTQTVVLNPGAPVPESYEDAGDIIVAYENFGVPSSVDSNGIRESKLAALPHGQEPSESEFKQLTDSVGYLYVSPEWLDVASSIEDQAEWAN
jgi:hypothetical protein